MEKLSATTNALNWFEIPIIDVERAKKFYETIFDIEMIPLEMMSMQMLMFPSQSPKSGGALVKSPYHTPSTTGALIYLNANPDLQLVLDKIESAGGTVTMPKTNIDPETGNMAFFIDTEGNLVGLHSGQ
ncbi:MULTISPECIES: VOC family protein [Arcicella]|uniref:VOC family protein n=1 Tax=Arcicella aquatica TaxID=217141 RepID=A0ABU5QNQ8_9BACT|nr:MULTISPECIES: VOC family protein [Arcicella]MDR6563048.1 putative enzyme related to lactoylglutathione lyase [Arcicella sp. BE51]MDR6813132.1 putative enzyme related to lactoylglutathione lyase [Arcicella sp. BE140]MDR6824446.1 putative enzyme related to lactoylglutathione lyase [Arcicella sp. BE139]MEA5258648.1 VOC family protein [Arcicella aquatica]